MLEGPGRPGRGVISGLVEFRPKTGGASGQASGLLGSWVSALYAVSADHACRNDVTKMLKDPSDPVFSWSHWPKRR